MHRILFFLTAALAACSNLLPVAAQDLMPPHVASRLGLTQAWMRPINAPFGAQSIADQKLYVHQIDPLEYVEIVQVTSDPKSADLQTAPVNSAAEAPESTAEKDAQSIVPEANILGRIETGRIAKATAEARLAEATRLAGNEVRRLKRRGIEAKLQVRKVPRVNLYSIATNGMLESRNAETGEINWTARVGDPRLPYRAIGVDDQHLAIINGSNLIEVDVNTGVELGKVQTTGTAMFGAVSAGGFALIPMIGGNIEGYALDDLARDPFLRSTSGSALAMPTKSPDSTRFAWGTDKGFVFVGESSGTPSILFRLKTDGIVSGRIAAASGDRFFFGSENGQAYGLRATRSGEVLWSQPFGEPFYNEPAVVGNQVLISSAYGNLVSFNADTGFPTWDRPIANIAELIGTFDDRIYVTTLSGALQVIEVTTGKTLGIFPEVQPGRLLINKLTNRLYLVSDRGEVQCLRPESSELPVFTKQPDTTAEEQPQQQATEQPATKNPLDAGREKPKDASDVDPFGGEGFDFGDDDPFAE